MSIEGFDVPLHRALTQPVLIGGAPREFTIANLTIGAVFLFSIGSPVGIPLVLGLHGAAVLLAKRDPYFLDTFKRHIHQPAYFHE